MSYDYVQNLFCLQKIWSSIRQNQTLLHCDMLQAKQNSSHWCFMFEKKKNQHDLWYCIYCIFALRVRFLAHIFICDFKERAHLHILCVKYILSVKALFSVVSISVFRKLTFGNMYRSLKRH